ncbi:MAG: prepilin-type N-terminal cleavage/methylation domain-containing protein [Proteobacteria bacterium]|nr:prepilin-type N-terminal cleavage/methylation domain-containing protein [Pseudomonadota bacterium]MCG2756923.1 prepilin-type N-terminal cleavage/methylation domain-containing protein [Desulfobacteraceae bacterium]
MCYSIENKERGFTLIELLIAMTIGLIIMAALSSTFLMQRKIYDVQEQIVEMVQNARAAMDMMSREIRMAGYDPSGLAGAGIVSATSNSINFTLDITDDAGTGPPDEDTGDANENITYSLYTGDGIQKLGRKSTAGAVNQPVAENIEDLQISQTGNSINVSLIARTTKPDPDYTDPTYGDHYHRYTLTSVITPRNLDL